MSVILEANNVTKVVGNGQVQTEIISSINLKIYENEFVVIMGESGSGKSSLLYLLGAMSLPNKGNVFYQGKDITSLSDKKLSQIRRNEFGFVFQSFNLIPVLTAAENISVPVMLNRQKVDKKRVMELLKLVGLEKYANHRPYQLSGGQQQRVAIARALIHQPSIIFADEPTGSLDSKSEDHILTMFQQIAQNRIARTIVMVTHSPKVAEVADRVIYIEDGKISDIDKKSRRNYV